jgi:molybdopterin adenylyltransferase
MSDTGDSFTAAVLTISDRCSRGETVDTSGPALVQLLRSRFAAEVRATALVPDYVGQIAQQILEWARISPIPDLILTTGGTGLSPRDVTPEATAKILERRHESLVQLMQMRCHEKTPRAFLSRGLAGTVGRSLVINLPGSKKGALECLEALADILPHAIQTLRNTVRDHGPAAR